MGHMPKWLSTPAALAPLLVASSVLAVEPIEPGEQTVRTDMSATVDDALYSAIVDDLGLSPRDIGQRLHAEALAARQQEILVQALDQTFAGAWFDADALALTVATTDPESMSAIQAAGVTPVLVEHSLQALRNGQQALDALIAVRAIDSVVATYVDVNGNQLVVELLAGHDRNTDELATAFASATDLPVRLESVDHRPALLESLPIPSYWYRGGDGYYNQTANGSCSLGFAVYRPSMLQATRGFVTAGHCGNVGDFVRSGTTGPSMGTFESSHFPGADMAFIKFYASAREVAEIVAPTVASIPVRGQTPSPIGAMTCRNGINTRWHCGAVQQLSVTVHYGGDLVVNGLTRTNSCAGPGDSGGPFISPDGQAQGVTSGGLVYGQCEMYFQPLQPILAAYDLTLRTDPNSVPASMAPSGINVVCPIYMGWHGNQGCEVQGSYGGPTGFMWTYDSIFHIPQNSSEVYFSCIPGLSATVTVRVSNFLGVSEASRSVMCQQGTEPM